MSSIPLDFETDAVMLPMPHLQSTLTIEQVFERRHSTRSYLPDTLPLQTLSTLLWAAFGVNRSDCGDRTAPSAHDWQSIDVYVVLAEGAYRYDALVNRLLLVSTRDLRAMTGMQDYVATAPLNLVYVADFMRMNTASALEREFLAGADAACIAENVYLACSAIGLGTVVRALVDRTTLSKALGLSPTQRIALAQSVGLPLH